MSAKTIALVVGGIVAMFLVQVLKTLPRIQDRVSLWVAYIVSLVVALFVYLISGGPPTPDGLVTAGGAIMGYSTIVYRQFLKAKGGSNPLVEAAG